MKRIFNFKAILMTGSLIMETLSLGMSISENEEVSQVIQKSMYEKLGVSSTSLFTIMTLFTIMLLVILVTITNSTSNVIKFKHNKAKKTGLLIFIGLLSSTSFAAENKTTTITSFIDFPDQVFWAFLILDIIIVAVILYFVRMMKSTLSDYKLKRNKKSIFSKLNKTLTNAVEIEDEDSILLDHDYDGILELDNDLPPWWKYGFYITIVWAGFYFFYYQVLEVGDLQNAEYEKAMIEGEKEIAAYKAAHPNLVNEDNVQLLTDQVSISLGKNVFNDKCVACHSGNAGGGIGPNLTDKYWIYDGDIKGVFHTISEGAENGMIAWKDMLAPDKIQAVSSYVLSLSPVENGKEPQGDNIVE